MLGIKPPGPLRMTLLFCEMPRSLAIPRIVSILKKMEIDERLILPSGKAQLASREFRREKSVICVGPIEIGTIRLDVIAGPCSVESGDQLLEAARAAQSQKQLYPED